MATLGGAVLVTRPEPGATVTAQRLESLGVPAIVAPLLQLRSQPVRFPRTDIAAILVTSGAAIPSLPVIDAPLYAVGDATAAKARDAGWMRVESAAGDASDLASLVASRHSPAGGALLLASGAGQGTVVAGSLRRMGYTVIRRVSYAAIPVDRMPETATEALAEGRLRAALFLSAETAKTFHRLLPPHLEDDLRVVDALTIGAPVAAALNAGAWRRVRVAARPTLEGVLALL